MDMTSGIHAIMLTPSGFLGGADSRGEGVAWVRPEGLCPVPWGGQRRDTGAVAGLRGILARRKAPRIPPHPVPQTRSAFLIPAAARRGYPPCSRRCPYYCRAA